MRPPFRADPVKLPRVQRIRRGDRVLCYHRPTGTRLPNLPESHPEFIAAWARAEAGGATPAARGTLAQAIRDLRAGAAWRALSPVYRSDMLRHLDAITTAHGDAPLRGLRGRHIETDLAGLDPNPANKRLRAWRLVLRHAKTTGQIEDDPSRGVAKRRARSDGHASWTAAEVAAFRARWPLGTPQRACFEVLAWTGARVSDACRMGRAQIGADGVLQFRQKKTGGAAYVPWTCALPSWARGWEADRALVHAAVARGFTFLETAHGKARSDAGLSNLIAAAARAAGIEGRSAHGLRKYRMTAIADAGGSAHAIMSWGGFASLSQAELYTRSANRRGAVMGKKEKTG